MSLECPKLCRIDQTVGSAKHEHTAKMDSPYLDLTEVTGEDATTIKEQIAEMRRLIAEKPDEKLWSDEDWYLLRFLRYRNYIPERALLQAKSYENFKTEQGPNWVEIPRPQFIEVMSTRVTQVLTTRHPNGARIMWLRVGAWQPSVASADTMLQICGVLAEIGEVEPRSQVAGVIAILDLADMGFTQIRNITPGLAKKIVSYLTTAFPMRMNGIHVVNESAFFSMVFALFKGLLDDRMRRRLFFHGYNRESLHEHLPANILPPELGGTQPQPEDSFYWKDTIFGETVTAGLKKVGVVFVNTPS